MNRWRRTGPPGLSSATTPLGASGPADPSRFDVVSTDLFDTVLLRDRTTESQRLATAGRRAAAVLGVDPRAVVALRWSLHASAYRAVALERPHGDATLTGITSAMATAMGLGEDAADVLRRTEVEVDATHLRSNRSLLRRLRAAAADGLRVIAVSDTYYSEADLQRLLDRVVGDQPFAAIYSSADLGLTKHAGGIFAEVCRREGVSPARVLHVGDSRTSDVTRAQAAGWTGVHLARSRSHAVAKRLGGVQSLPAVLQRAR